MLALHTDSSADLRELLEVLVNAEILIRHGVGANARFSFRHGLFQEIAYNSLLRSQRRAYHSQIADLIPNLLPNLAAKNPEIVARHCAAGGKIEQAVQHWRKAAHLAYSSSGFIEAVEFLRSALDQLPYIASECFDAQQPGTRGSGRPGHSSYRNQRRGLAGKSSRPITGQRRCCKKPTVRNSASRLCAGCRPSTKCVALLRTSLQLCERLMLVADVSGDPVEKVEALRRFGWCLFCRGDFATARTHLHEATSLYEPANAQDHIVQHSVDPWVLGKINLAWLEALAGNTMKARREFDEAVRYGSKLGHGLSLAYGLGISAAVYQTLGDI